jgi:hypothetical protein
MEEDRAGGEGSLVTSSEEEEEEELGRESSRMSYKDEEMCPQSTYYTHTNRV